MVLNPTMESISRDELEQLQVERLQSTLNRVYRNVHFYHQLFDQHNIDILTIKGVRDLEKLPFTTKDDLMKSYPYDMFAVPLKDILRIHSTSGTTGKPIVVGYTYNDLQHWTECTARVLAAAEITNHDVIQIAYHYSLFTGGFGFHQGAEKIGASVIPSSFSPNHHKQLLLMKDFKSTVLCCTPSYTVHLASTMREIGMHPEELNLRIGLFGAEPWSENLRTQLEEKLHITALDTYGLTEIMGPGVAGECQAKNGLHINEDHFIVEIINPETLEVLPIGAQGELVFTTITKEGFPLIRYRTGDISRLNAAQCECGRALVRMERVSGRTDDMIFFQEQKLFPSQIEQILLQIEGATPHYQIFLDRENGQEIMEIRVEILEQIPSIDELKTLENLRNAISKKIEADIGISAKIILVEPKSLQGEDKTGKTRRFIDNRKSM